MTAAKGEDDGRTQCTHASPRINYTIPGLKRHIAIASHRNEGGREKSEDITEYYRDRLKRWYMVAINFFLLLLDSFAWPCLGVAQQELQTFYTELSRTIAYFSR